MSARHFHRSARPFTIFLFHFHWVAGRRFLHLGSQHLRRPAIFTGRPDRLLYFTILLFHFHWVAGRRFLHLGPQKPACRPAIFTGRPGRLLFFYFISTGLQAGGFCISGRKICMPVRHFHRLLFHFHWVSGRGILHLGPQNLHVGSHFLHAGPPILHVRCTFASPRGFLYLGPPTLHVGSRFCMSAKHIPAQKGV